MGKKKCNWERRLSFCRNNFNNLFTRVSTNWGDYVNQTKSQRIKSSCFFAKGENRSSWEKNVNPVEQSRGSITPTNSGTESNLVVLAFQQCDPRQIFPMKGSSGWGRHFFRQWEVTDNRDQSVHVSFSCVLEQVACTYILSAFSAGENNYFRFVLPYSMQNWTLTRDREHNLTSNWP